MILFFHEPSKEFSMIVNNNKRIFLSFILLMIVSKIYFYMIFYIFGHDFFGGGNDADYYHEYAVGNLSYAVNVWPVILRFFNFYGLYNREIWSFINFIVSITFLPFIYANINSIGEFKKSFIKVLSFFIVVFYPTIFFFTFDVYRDVWLYFLFVLTVFVFSKFISSNGGEKFFFFFSFVLLCFFSFLFRPYLGFSLFVASFFCFSFIFRYFKTLVFMYFVLLLVFNYFGFFDSLLTYRGEEGFSEGGSSLGIGLIGRDPFSFVYLYLCSFFFQVFGFFYVGFKSVFVFVLESSFFIFAFFYVLKNIKFLPNIGLYLISFFVVYTSVWVMGNDNLGTAVRLRVPSYLSIFSCMLLIYGNGFKVNYRKKLDN